MIPTPETAESTHQPPSSPARPDNAAITPFLRSLVAFMDDAIRIPGTEMRIGFDAIIGALLPGFGDAATATSHLALLLTAFRMGVPRVVVLRMLLNIGIDAATGTVPVLGDVFDAGFKANRRNLQLIERHAETPQASTSRDHAFVWLVMGAAVALLSIPLVLTLWLASYLWQ